MPLEIRFGIPARGKYADMPEFLQEGVSVMSMAEYPLNGQYSGGLSMNVNDSEMFMVIASDPDTSWFRQVWKAPDGAIISDTINSGQSMYEFLGHYSWEIDKIGKYQVEVSTSIQSQPVIIPFEVVP